MEGTQQSTGTTPLAYTDAPSEQPDELVERDADGRLVTAEGKASDLIAVLLSVMPGTWASAACRAVVPALGAPARKKCGHRSTSPP